MKPLVLSGDALNRVCRAICQSWTFETGEGTCAVLCMESLGSARKNCAHQTRVHGRMGRKILEALAVARGASPDLLSIAKRWAALDGGAWNVERHAAEKAALLADTKAAIAEAEERS
jgi:hypothetical protein